ncbi:MAG TPA: DUF4132 domain-containing protein [Verrucomicrobiae bacterium]|nr:DUF4132 domain-containing protein [Verrucomicrobiae bacterium]
MALEQLRAWRAGIDQETLGPVERIGEDGYPLLANSELRNEHTIVSKLVALRGGSVGEVASAERTKLLLTLLERMFAYSAELSTPSGYRHVYASFFDYGPAATIARDLFRAGTDEEVTARAVLEWFSCYRINYYGTGLLRVALQAFVNKARTGSLSEDERALLIRVRGQSLEVDYSASEGFHASQNNEAVVDERIASVIDRVIGPGLWSAIIPCEVWSVRALKDLEETDAAERQAWVEMLNHCQSATSARPSAKWLKTGKAAVEKIGRERFRQKLLDWFPLVEKGRGGPMLCMSWEAIDESQRMHTINAVILRGLLWLCPDFANPELTRAIGRLASSAYKKVRGLGPRAVKVGNAATYALSAIGNLDAVGQLAILQAKVKFGTAQKELGKAFTAAAEALKIPSDEIQEIGIPSYGLTDVGICEEKFGEFTARLKVTGTTKTELGWTNAGGKVQKGVPSAVKEKYSEELKELKASAKDIETMLPAQRDRIDGMFLQQRSWPAAVWRERYLEHPLVGTLARRILWEFTKDGKTVAGIWFDGRVVDLDLKAVDSAGATVRFWHPIGKNLDEVVAWRSWLETQQIQQPFKQAHREIYLLTDAELQTGTYSNRYAAHVLKQHQFNALCAARGWKNQLRLMVDSEYAPPSLFLPQWGLRAEFWVEGIGAEYGTDTAESGAYLRLSTDQVRFYRMEAEQRTAHAGGGGYHAWRGEGADPVAVREIPELVFSEVMRDVDLFVGVASIGNDPTWSDGGPDGRYAGYWQDYSFGALSGTAKTRKDVLQRLVPKLKIAPVSSFTEKFLVVKGKLRTYKIHLGSGNILMEPNDQYLCIVPKQSQETDRGDVMLPFEGDRTLSVILSKAFLLAADDKIKDGSIVSQIQRW